MTCVCVCICLLFREISAFSTRVYSEIVSDVGTRVNRVRGSYNMHTCVCAVYSQFRPFTPHSGAENCSLLFLYYFFFLGPTDGKSYNTRRGRGHRSMTRLSLAVIACAVRSSGEEQVAEATKIAEVK